MDAKNLQKTLDSHSAWLRGEDGGVRADLRRADLRRANLSDADLRRANLSDADLRRANLSDADLSDADLSGAVYDEGTAFFALQCCEKGAFIGYKKCKGNLIVELEILADAKRSSATTRKCRCSAAKVLSITQINGEPAGDSAVSTKDSDFVYKVGEIVSVDNFDDNRWNECSPGIHFFITRQEAVNY